MAQQVKALDTKPDNLSLILEADEEGGRGELMVPNCPLTLTSTYACTHTTHKLNKM